MSVGAITKDILELYVGNDALGLAERVRVGDVTAVELVETAIAVIEGSDQQLNAVVIRTFEEARDAAGASGAGLLAGVPFLMKNIGSMWKGTPLTAGLKYLEDFVCEYDSAMVSRIKESGLLMLGRTNTPENGWSIGTEPDLYGPTLNPWNAAFTPGGSSGGAAAAVAAGMVPITEASDGGGSIRAPASCCSLVGLKPSRGRITYGSEEVDLWFGSIATFCLSRSMRDSAAFLDVVAGNADGDPYLLPKLDSPWLSTLEVAPTPLKIGLIKTQPWGDEPCHPDVLVAVDRMARLCEMMGHDVEETSPRAGPDEPARTFLSRANRDARVRQS